MKRSLVVFVALGLLAGLVGCGGSTDSSSDPLSEAETEARQLLIDATTENLKPIFEEINITSISAGEFATCYLDKHEERSPLYKIEIDMETYVITGTQEDPRYWRKEKASELDKTNFFGFESASDEYLAWRECQSNRLTQQESDRFFDLYLDSIFPDREKESVTSTEPVTSPEQTRTVSQQQAEQLAEDYLNYSAFSRSGLIDQLEYEGFSTADATYGVDAQNANWNAQAALMAQDYLDYSSFSRTGLIDQLIFEGFTRAQATYGVNAVGL